MPIRSMRALLLSALLLFILTIAPAAGAHTVTRSLADAELVDASPTERVQIMDEYTLEAPRTVRRGRAATLRGALTCSRLEPATTGVAGKDLTLQRRLQLQRAPHQRRPLSPRMVRRDREPRPLDLREVSGGAAPPPGLTRPAQGSAHTRWRRPRG